VALELLLPLPPLLPSLQLVRMLKLLQQQQQLRLCKLLFLLPIFFSSSQFPQLSLSLSLSMFSCLRFFLTLLSALSRVLQQYSTLRFRAKTNSSSYGTQISFSLSLSLSINLLS
jgi:hypothetical protein